MLLKNLDNNNLSRKLYSVDWGQVCYLIAKSLGYGVQFVHVKCRVSGTAILD